jgi:hypothetical protein
VGSHSRTAAPPGDHVPLLHWDEQALAFVADKVGRAVLAWAEDWTAAAAPSAGVPDAACASACVGAPQAHACQAFRLHGDAARNPSEGAWLGYGKSQASRRAIQPADLVGRQGYGGGTGVEPGSIAAELGQEALTHLVTALRAALAIEGDADRFDLPSSATTLPGDEFREWSGGVRVTLPGLEDVTLYLGGMAVARLDPPKRKGAAVEKTPLTALDAAVGPAPAVLRAQLQPVELTLGQLRSLQVGDVVVLPHALDRALDVTAADGTLVCEAYLGRMGGHRALEVLPPKEQRAA